LSCFYYCCYCFSCLFFCYWCAAFKNGSVRKSRGACLNDSGTKEKTWSKKFSASSSIETIGWLALSPDILWLNIYILLTF
jgi:hypothetical protein